VEIKPYPELSGKVAALKQVIALENVPAKKGGIASTLKSAVGSYDGWTITVEVRYRGTSLIRNNASLGPYSRTVARALWWS